MLCDGLDDEFRLGCVEVVRAREFGGFDAEAFPGAAGHPVRAQGAVIAGQQLGRGDSGGVFTGGFGVGPGEVGQVQGGQALA